MRDELASEGFQHVNATVPVWAPGGEGDELRGYILARQFAPHVDEAKRAPFYIVQLTRPCAAVVGPDGLGESPAGTAVCVYESETTSICRKLIANYQTVQQNGVAMQVPVFAYEVAMIAQKNDRGSKESLLIEVHTRRVGSAQAQPPIAQQPPPFTLPAVDLGAIAKTKRKKRNTALTEIGPKSPAVPPPNATP